MKNNGSPKLYFIVLGYLYKEGGLNSKMDVTTLMNEYFKNNDIIDGYWDLKKENSLKFLEQMMKAGHIDYDVYNFGVSENSPLFCSLTVSGFLFHKEHKTSIRSNLFSIVALIIAGISALFTGYDIFKSTDKHEEKHEQALKHKKEVLKTPPSIAKDSIAFKKH
ncbi:hypothetical protein [Pedobacter sp. JCM 36344]|uniref:hypothetical protein n=1 Tax=Pedobacter sp. JCM 36344 TaxID=3374280 RepID=UPI00397B1C25